MIGASASEWLKGAAGRIDQIGSYVFAVGGLKPDTEHDVRVLLLDNEFQAFAPVPQVRVRTLGPSEFLL